MKYLMLNVSIVEVNHFGRSYQIGSMVACILLFYNTIYAKVQIYEFAICCDLVCEDCDGELPSFTFQV